MDGNLPPKAVISGSGERAMELVAATTWKIPWISFHSGFIFPVHHKRGGEQVESGWLHECLNLNKQLILNNSLNAIHPNKDEDHPG